MAKKMLIDYLLEHSLVSNAEDAIKQVLAGNIISNFRKFSSIYQKIEKDESIRLKKAESLYVSRGGDKLASVFKNFNINIQNKIGLDCGASTGGFSDFLLQNGAFKIITIDVGYGLLDEKLRKDKRIINFERTNIRNINKADFQEALNSHKNGPILLPLDFCVADLSFISLRKILPVITTLLRKEADIIALYKPQFELPKDSIPEGGIVSDNELINSHLNSFIELMDNEGLKHVKTLPSLVQGIKGNQEYFIHFKVF